MHSAKECLCTDVAPERLREINTMLKLGFSTMYIQGFVNVLFSKKFFFVKYSLREYLGRMK